MFLIKYTVHNGLQDLTHLPWHLDWYVLPFVPGASRRRSDHQHLEFAGCGTISIGQVQTEQALLRSYSGVLCKGFTEEEAQTVGLTSKDKAGLIIPCLHDDSLLQASALHNKEMDAF